MSELVPAFVVRACFVDANRIEATERSALKYEISFGVDMVNRNKRKSTFVPMETAVAIGSFLTCKVDSQTYDLIKHLLKEDTDLSLTICPLPWKVENSSGMYYDFVGLERFSELLNAA